MQAVAQRKSRSNEFTIIGSAPTLSTGQQPRAVVIDDDAGIRNAVGAALLSAGYAVEFGDTGASGLRLAQSVPDVMVLDLNLPDLSGLAVCRALRGARKTADIPIVFLTATNDDTVVANCFVAGATDYLVKPFVPEVLAVRVNRVAAVRLAEVERQNRSIELQAATDALHEAKAIVSVQHKLSGLGVLVSGVANEMTGPLASIMASLKQAGSDLSVPGTTATLTETLQSAENLGALVRQLRGIAGSDERARVDIDLRARCELVSRGFNTVAMSIDGPANVVISAVDAEVREALIAVIDNAVRAAKNRPPPRVAITIRDDGDVGTIIVDDCGAGIADRDLPWLFTPFYKRDPAHTTGMGLSLVHAAVRRHGGTVTVEGHGPLGGARVIIGLPKNAVDVADIDDTPMMTIRY